MGLQLTFMSQYGTEGNYIKIESTTYIASKPMGLLCLSMWKDRISSKSGSLPVDFIDIEMITKDQSLANLYTNIKDMDVSLRTRSNVIVNLSNSQDVLE